MNRAERRKQTSILKRGKPTDHFHSKYSQEDLNKVKEKVRDFLKIYTFDGSAFEETYKRDKFLEKLSGQADVIIKLTDDLPNVITLETNYPIVVDPIKKQIIKTDIFLVKEKTGWFIKYDKLPFVQNLLIAVLETGFEYMMDNEINASAKMYGYLIPYSNRLIRKAFDRLSLRYGSEWVA